jgi:hypothetical protein
VESKPTLKSTIRIAEPRLKGSLAYREHPERGVRVAGPEPIPGDYDMSPEVADKIIKRRDNPDYVSFADPEGIITPGLLLISSVDPDHRRLVTNMYEANGGRSRNVSVHIEGADTLNNVSLESLHEKLADGRLAVPPPPEAPV